MNTIISNNIVIKDADPKVYWWCRDNLMVTNPTYATMVRLGKEDQIRRMHVQPKMALYSERGMDIIVPFGCLRAVWGLIKDSPYETRLNSCKDINAKNDTISQPLFPYQEEAVSAMVSAKGGVLEGSCGCGKTQIGIEIAKRIGKNALWLCHTGDLLRQTVARIKMLYPRMHVGTITEGEVKMTDDGITVATVQTMSMLDKSIYSNCFDTIVTDECHRLSGSPTMMKMFVKVVQAIPARYKYGLSATLTRADGMIKSTYATLGCNTSGELAPTFSIKKEQTNTLTAEHIRVDLDTPFDYSCLNDDGTFNYANLIDYLSQNDERNEKIAENVLAQREKHHKQLVLCQRVEQCERLDALLKEKGVKSAVLVGKVSNKNRAKILGGENDAEVIVATYSLAKEGLDMPELSCLHMAMLTCDKSATIQSVGRIERKCDGKPSPEAYDYVDKNYPYCVNRYKKRVSYLRRR